MNKLPEKFPEYSIMYKTLVKRICQLESAKEKSINPGEIACIQKSIDNYKSEIEKIKKMFPEKFFERF